MENTFIGNGLIILGVIAIINGGFFWNLSNSKIASWLGLIVALFGFYLSFCGVDVLDPTFFQRQFDVDFFNIF